MTETGVRKYMHEVWSKHPVLSLHADKVEA